MKIALYLIVGFCIGWLTVSWTLMIAVGVVHHEWWGQVPTMSYSAALAVLAMPMAVAYIAAALRGWVSS